MPVLPKYADMKFIFFHITTSSNGCKTIRSNGLYNLQKTYKSLNSELRNFLDSVGVEIDLETATLRHKQKSYCIEFDNGRVDSAEWAVGRKFYYDFCVCGFLSISNNYEYGGYVHRRPEILFDIDNLLNTNYIHKTLDGKQESLSDYCMCE